MRNKFTEPQVRKFWNSVAGIYDDENAKFDYAHTQRFYQAIEFMSLRKGERLLNVWSRTGEAIQYLRKSFPGIKIDNIELSDKFVEKAKKAVPMEKFIRGTLHKFPFRDNTFDCVMSLETLEHTAEPEKFLGEIYRVLKPGKKLVMSLPPATVEYTSVIADFFHIGHGEGPHKFLSSWSVKKMLRKAGFRVLKHKGTVLVPVGPKFLKKFGYWLEPFVQGTIFAELGIRQFYVAKK